MTATEFYNVSIYVCTALTNHFYGFKKAGEISQWKVEAAKAVFPQKKLKSLIFQTDSTFNFIKNLRDVKLKHRPGP